MRVALVYPFRKAGLHSCNPPLALLYLATSLEAAGHEVSVIDRDAYASDYPGFIEKIRNYEPDLVGMPIFTLTPVFKAVREVCRDLREKLPDAIFLAGGPSSTALPEETLQWYPEIDYVLQGEADITICDLMDQLDRNVADPDVPGLCYRRNGAVHSIPRADPPADLDALPIPDRKFVWDNFKSNTYWRLDHKGPVDLIVTSRGCPFNCRFCFKTEKKFRYRSAENVMSELEYLASIGNKNIDIEDDLFTANKKRCLSICRMIQDAGLSLKLKARSRVDTIDEEMLHEMRNAGVHTVVYGIESGSDRILKAMGKKTSVERNFEVVKMTKKAGLRCHCDILVGFPGEDEESIRGTEKFLKKACPSTMLTSAMMPWPCTPVFDEAKSNGTLVGKWSPDTPPPYIKLPWMNDYSTLKRRSHQVTNRFYRDPRVMAGLVKNAPKNMHTFRIGLKWFRNRVGV